MNERNEKKFDYPDLLYTVQMMSRCIDYFDETQRKFSELLEWLESEQEDGKQENKKNIPVQIILQLILEKSNDFKLTLESFHEEFPSMSLEEWRKLKSRWPKFIEQMNDLKIN